MPTLKTEWTIHHAQNHSIKKICFGAQLLLPPASPLLVEWSLEKIEEGAQARGRIGTSQQSKWSAG